MKRELLTALRNIIKTRGEFKFGYMHVPKGTEFDIENGLNEELELDLKDWILNYLAPESEHHPTDYVLTFEGDVLCLDCRTSWGGWCYEGSYTSQDVLREEVVKLLLPDTDFSAVDLESLHLSFEYNLEDNEPSFKWWSQVASYHDNGEDVEIELKPIRKELEKTLSLVLFDLVEFGGVEHEGVYSKTITVEESIPTVVESLNFTLKIDAEEFEFDDD